MRVLAFLLVALVTTAASAQEPVVEPPEPEPPAPLRVVVAGNAPFVLPGDELNGISVRIWEELADDIEREFELERVDSVADALQRVEQGRADVAIGPISITAERAQRVAFTQPYYESALSILAVETTPGVWQRVKPFMSGPFLRGFGVFLLILLFVGHLFWRVERKHNDDFPDGALRGTGVGVWLAIVTLTTVGYGDKAPRTAGGRVVAGVFMIVSMVSVSSLTAFLATTLTVASLEHGAIATAGDLNGRKVASVEGSTGSLFARSHGASIVAVENVGGAVEAVAEERAEAVVYDRPMLQYELRSTPREGLVISPSSYEPQGYGFAVNHENVQLESQLDVGLLELAESGVLDRVVDQWLGE